MPADWYTISWENAKSYTLNDKIGMVNYPAPNLYGEYFGVNNDASKLANWKFLAQMPIEGGKGAPGGNAGTLYIIPKANIGEDTGKLARICHILDAMCYGGEAYFQTVQNGSAEVGKQLVMKTLAVTGNSPKKEDPTATSRELLPKIRIRYIPLTPPVCLWLRGRTSVLL